MLPGVPLIAVDCVQELGATAVSVQDSMHVKMGRAPWLGAESSVWMSYAVRYGNPCFHMCSISCSMTAAAQKEVDVKGIA